MRLAPPGLIIEKQISSEPMARPNLDDEATLNRWISPLVHIFVRLRFLQRLASLLRDPAAYVGTGEPGGPHDPS